MNTSAARVAADRPAGADGLAAVLARPDVWRGGHFAAASLPALASGFAALDAELPGGGWPRGALTELLVDGVGLGELGLLLPALRAVRAAGGWSLLVGAPYPLHAPAWAAAGLDLARLVIVSPSAERDALWAMEQALASAAPAAVLCWTAGAAARAVRRLQVAAAAGGAAAFLFRPARAAATASAAPLRLALAADAAGRCAVSILKRRGPPLAAPIHLDLPRPVRNHESALAGARSAPAAARSAFQPACA
ncbi:MAG: translesion DNA synthesis-associated protein ImuA [Rhodocyclaceae bacterium]|nr:translesion DNA synthesis-associated protein ImuA [Rhodocyclaceae bacterium]